MDDKPAKNTSKRRRDSDKVSLDSWKAIAVYLNRSVRTVRRWETTEGLPVHRHRHTKGFSVYAYQSELDAWRSANQDMRTKAPIEVTESPPINSRPNGLQVAMALLAIVTIGALAGTYVDRADRSQGDDVTVYWPQSAAQVHVAPVFSAWADGRIREALDESQRIAQQLPDLPTDVRGYVIDYLIVFSLNLGRVDDAERLLADLPDGVQRDSLAARIAFAAGDMTRVPEVLKNGKSSAALSPPQSDVFLAMKAKNAGDLAEAKMRLKSATSELAVEDQGYFFVALDMLAGVLNSEGELTQAIGVLERTMPERHAAARNRSGLFWLMCQRRLAILYREAGSNGMADKIENELRNWLILADDDFPLAMSLADV